MLLFGVCMWYMGNRTHVWGDCSCLWVRVQKPKEGIGCPDLSISVLFLEMQSLSKLKVSWRLEWPSDHLSVSPTASGHQNALTRGILCGCGDLTSCLYDCKASTLLYWSIHPASIIWLNILDTLLVVPYCGSEFYFPYNEQCWVFMCLASICITDLEKFQFLNPAFNLGFEGLDVVEFWELFNIFSMLVPYCIFHTFFKNIVSHFVDCLLVLLIITSEIQF